MKFISVVLLGAFIYSTYCLVQTEKELDAYKIECQSVLIMTQIKWKNILDENNKSWQKVLIDGELHE